MDEDVMLVKATETLEYADAILGLGIESFLEVGDVRPVVFQGPRVLDLDAVPPVQVVRGTLVGQAVLLDDAYREAGKVRGVYLVGEVVVGGSYAGEHVLVGGQLVHLFDGNVRPFLENRRRLEVGVPVRPVAVEAVFLGPDARQVVAPEMVVYVYQGRIYE
jgi:hypothetical protein